MGVGKSIHRHDDIIMQNRYGSKAYSYHRLVLSNKTCVCNVKRDGDAGAGAAAERKPARGDFTSFRLSANPTTKECVLCCPPFFSVCVCVCVCLFVGLT